MLKGVFIQYADQTYQCAQLLPSEEQLSRDLLFCSKPHSGRLQAMETPYYHRVQDLLFHDCGSSVLEGQVATIPAALHKMKTKLYTIIYMAKC